MRHAGFPALVLCAAFLAPLAASHAQAPQTVDPPDVVLKPTNHPRLPADASQLWLAPLKSAAPRSAATTEFVAAVKLEVDTNFAKALPMLSQPAVQQGLLGDYALYYQGLAELRVGRPAEARKTFQSLAAKHPTGYLNEAAALREAECVEAQTDHAAAMEIYERLSKTKTTAPDDVLMRLGRAARAAGDLQKSTEAFSRVVYEFPFSDLAIVASGELETLPIAPIAAGSSRYKLEVGRAERLFGAKRYQPAKIAFEGVRAASQGNDRELVDIRLAECDYLLKRPRNARDALKPYTEKSSRQGEALYFYAVSIRDLGDKDGYLRIVRQLTEEFASQSWAEEALNNLATYYILQSDDEDADATFREMYEKFPMGHYAERAAWKIGWFAYRHGRYVDAVRAFESAAAHFPRSDYRPSWLYWSARAHESLQESALADARYTLVATDYLNTYYGRLALKRLDAGGPQRRVALAAVHAAATDPNASDAPVVPPLPQNEHVIRALLALDLYDQALDELHYAQKNWGDSSAIQATIGWIYHQRGDLRAGINAIKRAYPQYMAAGGEALPSELLKVLFPVEYWPLIQRYSLEHQLDPYMVAALIAQESNFIPDVRSPANAYGLMQLVPAAGRQYAKTINKRYSLSLLTTADSNLRMGTAYFADLVQKFGGAHYALASYNAGPARVAHWMAERPGVDRDVFIDDIPFPETQAYVKKIIGTAEDYRHLYGSEATASGEAEPVKAPPATAAPAAAKPAAKKKAPVKKKAAVKSGAA
jgi:soluble lytic murein transglycosylase